MKKLLIIGVDGFVGSVLQKEFSKLFEIYGVGLSESVDNKYYTSNIENKSDIKAVIKKIKPHYVINLAAKLSTSVDYRDYDKMYETNVNGLRNIFESIIEEGILLEHFVSFSSCEVYGDNCCNVSEDDTIYPTSIYSLTKTIGENIARYYSSVYKIPVTIVRPSLIYGEGQKGRFFIYNLIRSIKENKSFDTTLGEQTRDFIHVYDVFYACRVIISKSLFINETVNLSFGKSYKLKEIINMAICISHSPIKINWGAIPYRESEIMNYSVSNSKIREIISDFPTVTVEKGLTKVLDYYDQEENNG